MPFYDFSHFPHYRILGIAYGTWHQSRTGPPLRCLPAWSAHVYRPLTSLGVRCVVPDETPQPQVLGDMRSNLRIPNQARSGYRTIQRLHFRRTWKLNEEAAGALMRLKWGSCPCPRRRFLPVRPVHAPGMARRSDTNRTMNPKYFGRVEFLGWIDV